MRILGIDPGTGRIGFGVLEQTSELSVIDYGLIHPQHPSRKERLFAIHQEVLNLFKKYKPDLLALERLFFSKNIKTAFGVAEAIGVILLAAEQAKVPVHEYTPQEVKEVVTGSGRAKKHEVKGVLELLLNQKIKGPDDVSDALAVAFCHFSLAGLGI